MNDINNELIESQKNLYEELPGINLVIDEIPFEKMNRALIKKNPSELIAYDRNPRTHSDEQIEQLMKSIQEFGFVSPILIDEKDMVLAGHGRLQAVRNLGLKEVMCLRITDLSDNQKKAYVIADNQLALNAGWDQALLKSQMEEIELAGFDLDILGFPETPEIFQGDIDDFFEETESKEKKAKTATCPECGNVFEL